MSAKTYFNGFGSYRKERGLCVEGMLQDWFGKKKKTNLAVINVLLFCCNKDLIRARLPIYYGKSSSIFCQLSGLKEAFKKINKHTTGQKLKF